MRRAFGAKEVVISQARGGVKMSEVLREFLDPYWESAETKDDVEKLATLGVMAWNAAVLPDRKERSHFMLKLLDAVPKVDREPAMAIIEEMVDRKERFFSQHERMILGFELTETDTDWRLSTISSAAEPG